LQQFDIKPAAQKLIKQSEALAAKITVEIQKLESYNYQELKIIYV
jgi:hypothetical protein